VEEIAGAGGNLMVEDARNLGEIVVNTYINDAKMEAMLATEHVDTTPTLGEVNHLLPSHLTGRNANTFPFYAMVATKKEVARMRNGGS
jgi:hypothetical protein